MATTNEVLDQVADLLNRLNRPARGSAIGAFLRHPIVVTVVASVSIAVGSNIVTKAFQLRDKQSEAVASLESQIPAELLGITHLAMLSSVLESEGCSNDPEKKLRFPLVYGLSGKSCQDAEAEYLKYQTLYLQRPPGASLVRIRALFSSPAVDEGAQKLGALIGVLSATREDRCILHVAQKADAAYEELVELAIREIDGDKVRETPDEFNLTDLPAHCTAEDLCRVRAITKDATVKAKCK